MVPKMAPHCMASALHSETTRRRFESSGCHFGCQLLARKDEGHKGVGRQPIKKTPPAMMLKTDEVTFLRGCK